MRSALPVLDDAARSSDPSVCPFFRREVDGLLVTPLLEPDDENRCAAIGAPRPQSLHQQELVCLRQAHADCPRYLRGALATGDEPIPRRPATMPRATMAALLVLILSAGLSFGFVLQRGGIDLPVVEGGATSTAVAAVPTPTPAGTEAPTPTPAGTAAPTSAPAGTEAPTTAPTVAATLTPPPTASPTSSPTPSPIPTVAPTPAPTRRPAATPTSSRYALLRRCPDRDGCWIYRVRSGDNLYSIANYFGHSLSTIYKWNPQYPATRLRVGDPIRMPPPTR